MLEPLEVAVPVLADTEPDSVFAVAQERANMLSSVPVTDLEYSRSEAQGSNLKLLIFSGLGVRS